MEDLEKATMGFFWQLGGGRESVMNFIFSECLLCARQVLHAGDK